MIHHMIVKVEVGVVAEQGTVTTKVNAVDVTKSINIIKKHITVRQSTKIRKENISSSGKCIVAKDIKIYRLSVYLCCSYVYYLYT